MSSCIAVKMKTMFSENETESEKTDDERTEDETLRYT